jgi:hypothetical protein
MGELSLVTVTTDTDASVNYVEQRGPPTLQNIVLQLKGIIMLPIVSDIVTAISDFLASGLELITGSIQGGGAA